MEQAVKRRFFNFYIYYRLNSFGVSTFLPMNFFMAFAISTFDLLEESPTTYLPLTYLTFVFKMLFFQGWQWAGDTGWTLSGCRLPYRQPPPWPLRPPPRTYWKRLTSTVMPCVSKSKYRMEGNSGLFFGSGFLSGRIRAIFLVNSNGKNFMCIGYTNIGGSIRVQKRDVFL